MQNKENDINYIISGREVKLQRPEPILGDIEVLAYKKRMNPEVAVEVLLEGHYVLISDFFSSGLLVLNALKKELKSQFKDASFKGQRDFRSTFRTLSNRIVLEVNNSKLKVRKSPEIGWFKILYPELDEFLLPFPQVQGLNSAWQWYQKGIKIPVLTKKVFPFFGTYFPTRFEHLDLFEQWLNKYEGSKKSAIDIGVGSGVLSFQILKHGFDKIYATDTNPNAIIGLDKQRNRNPLISKIELLFGDLFSDCNATSELIVFNPPWIPTDHNAQGIDKAIYYDEDLFPNFFEQAEKHLDKDGRVVLLFSNLAQVTGVTTKNPIEEEILNGGRFQKDVLLKSSVVKASTKTRRDQNWRESEAVELWVLKRIEA